MRLPQLLADFKIDAGPLLKRMGHSSSLFSESENTISMHAMGELLRQCVKVTDCPYFGLLLGRQGQLMGFGLLGEILPHCANVGTALTYLQDHFHLHDRGGIATRDVNGKVVSLGYTILDRTVLGADQIQDAALAMGFNIMRALCGTGWKPGSVHFSHRRPADIRPYQQTFACPLQFDAVSTSMASSVNDLGLSVTGADPERFALLNERLCPLRNKYDLNFLDVVRRTVQALIALHRCSVSEVAQAVGMTRRRLNRHLERENTSVRTLMNEARCSLALRLLTHTNLSMAQIAAVLDYASPSAFNHAFVSWKGVAPLDWRRNRMDSQLFADGRHEAG